MIRDFWRYFQTLWNNFENGQFSWCFNFHLVSQKSLSKVQGLIEIRSDKWWALLKSQVVNFSPTFYKWGFFFFQVRLNFSICLYADSNRCQIGFSAKRSRNIFCQDFFYEEYYYYARQPYHANISFVMGQLQIFLRFFLLLTKVLPKNRADLRVVGGQKISFLDHDFLRWYFLQLCEK